jgi:hypothetical protein
MADEPHFLSAASWTAARTLLAFEPVEPAFTAGCDLKGLRIFVRDHTMRELPPGERSLEAYYERFVVSESRKGIEDARRLALDVRYGRDPREGAIAGHPARIYELGPEPEPEDIDGRPPAVVTWHDGEMFFLVASGELSAADLIPVAASMYADSRARTAVAAFDEP